MIGIKKSLIGHRAAGYNIDKRDYSALPVGAISGVETNPQPKIEIDEARDMREEH